MKIHFPQNNPKWGKKPNLSDPGQYHRYYNIHILYFLNILINAGADVELINAERFKIRSMTSFEFLVDKKLCLVDFSDFEELKIKDLTKYKAVFKFHFNPILHSKYKNVYPFSPVNFHDWNVYESIKNEFKYTASGKICNQQSPAGNAIKRRRDVQSLLIETYKDNLIYEKTNQLMFFKNIQNCAVSVCVPGARNNMLDRGQGQYMFFGVCTISPKLVTYLSWNKKPEAGIHYVECKSDYSDLIDKITWCINNKNECIKIGNRAKELMNETSLPLKQVEWIKKCIYSE